MSNQSGMVALIRSTLLGLAGLGICTAGRPAEAQQCPAVLRAEGQDLAQRYAPVLFFAPGETYYPTIPVFPAWRGNGLQHLETTVPLDGERVSWDSLHIRYLREVHASERAMSKEVSKIHPPVPALFYQSACLSIGEKRQLRGFLKNDPQAWPRLRVDTLFANGLEDAEFVSITYYHYYIRDGGLEGHGHDSERIVVFRPVSVDPARTRHRREEEMNKQAQVQVRLESDSIRALPARLLILVGTGHSPTTPNNVLVVRADDAQALQHPSVLIELAGHSSAPDFNRDAAFSPGLDLNWNLAGAIWGTRDIQSIGGLAYLGGYKSWMTIPRTRGTFLTLAPSEAGESGTKHVPRIIDTVYQRGVLTDTSDAYPYTLLPIEPFRELDSLTAAYRKSGCVASDTTLDAVIAMVNGTMMSLLRKETGFQGFGGLSRERVSAIACLMGRWTDPMAARTVSKLTARAPWDHAEYGASRIATLKKQLFRPTSPGLQGVSGLVSLLAVSTNTRLGGGTHQAQLGLVVPVFALNDLLAIPGIIEAYVGPARTSFLRKNAGPTRWGSVSVIYDRQYKSTVSWYFGFDRIRRRRLVTGDDRAGDVAMVGGASLMPFFFKPDLIPALATRVRIRFGVQLWQRGGDLTLGGFELRTALYLK
jgi:hypothetical protein